MGWGDGFDPVFIAAVNSLLAACPGSSVGSGSRTYEQQAALYASKGAWSETNPGAAAPGTSNHEVGNKGAADLRAGEGGYECLHAKAGQFGLHFPLSNEEWHVEPTDELLARYGQDPNATDPQAPVADPMAEAERILFGGATTDPGQVVAERERMTAAAEADVDAVAQAGAQQAAAESMPADAGTSGAQIANALYQAGFRGEALVTMLATAMGESGWNAQATGDTTLTNGTWGPSVGVFQIRTLNAERGTGGWRDEQALRGSLLHQAKAAFAISNGGTNFGPWTIYSNGAYTQHMAAARQAAAGVDAGGGAVVPPQIDKPVTPVADETVDEDTLLATPVDDLSTPIGVSGTADAPDPDRLKESGLEAVMADG